MKKYSLIILMTFLIMLPFFDCAGLIDGGKHGASYKNACDSLKRELLKVRDISITFTRNTDAVLSPARSNGLRYRIDYSERAAYINENYARLIREVEHFRSGMARYEAKFRDDVEMVEVMFYFSLSMPGSRAIPDFYNSAGEMIRRGVAIQLEPETTECFKEIKQFRLFFDPGMWDTEGERLVADLVREEAMAGVIVHALVGVAVVDEVNMEKADELIHEYQSFLSEEHLKWLQGAVSKAEVLSR